MGTNPNSHMQICKRLFGKYGYAVIPLLSTFLLNDLVYWGGMAIAGNRYHFDLTLDLDRMLPFVPGFVYIYLICYLFWVVNYLLAAGNGKDYFYRYLTADLTARVVCFLFFVFFPTTNLRPELVGDSLSITLLRWLYQMDKPENLLPSIHCMNSWFCYIAVRGRKDIPCWYRIFSFVFAWLIALSTVLIRQHVVVDIAAGFLLAEAMWQFYGKMKYYKNVRQFYEKINGIIRRKLLK